VQDAARRAPRNGAPRAAAPNPNALRAGPRDRRGLCPACAAARGVARAVLMEFSVAIEADRRKTIGR